MTIPAYPLQWPAGWTRLHGKVSARFGKSARESSSWTDSGGVRHESAYNRKRELSIADAVERVRRIMSQMGLPDDEIVISTNLELRLDGFPRSNQREPSDPGAAVYWRNRLGDATGTPKCMAIDKYDRVADNLAAIAATLDAMRAIERHGGAEILSRAFTGFVALEGPTQWHIVLGVPANASTEHVRANYLKARSQFHPDRGGGVETFDAIQRAWQSFCIERGINQT